MVTKILESFTGARLHEKMQLQCSSVPAVTFKFLTPKAPFAIADDILKYFLFSFIYFILFFSKKISLDIS